MRWLAACLLLVAGCGRVAFDNTGAVDASVDTPPDALVESISAREVAPPAFTTSSVDFVDVPGGTIVVPASLGQKWLLIASAYLTSSSLHYRGPEARYLVDGIERGLGGTESLDVAQPGPWQHVYMFDGGTDPVTIQVQLRDAMAATATIDRLHAVVVPLDASWDPLFATNDATVSVSTSTLATATSLTVTPASPGEYLMLLTVNTTEAPGGSDIVTQWLDPTGAPWGPSFKITRGSWQSIVLARRVQLTGPATIELQASSGSTSELKYARIAALRVPALPSFSMIESLARPETISAVPMVSAQLAVDAAPAAQYVVFGTTRVDDRCIGVPGARGVQFVVDGETNDISHLPGNCAYEVTYGHVDLRPARPATVSGSFSSPDGEQMRHEETTLFVLGVD